MSGNDVLDEKIEKLVSEINETYSSSTSKYHDRQANPHQRQLDRRRFLPRIVEIANAKVCSTRATPQDVESLGLFVKVFNESVQALEHLEKNPSRVKYNPYQHLKPTLCAFFETTEKFKETYQQVVEELKAAKKNSTMHLLSNEFYDKVLDHYTESVYNHIAEGGKDGPLGGETFVQGFGSTEFGKEKLGVRYDGVGPSSCASSVQKTSCDTSNLILFTTNQGRKIRELEQIVSQQQEQINQLMSMVKNMQHTQDQELDLPLPPAAPAETDVKPRCFYCQPDCYYATCYVDDQDGKIDESTIEK